MKNIKDVVPQNSVPRSMGKPRVTPLGFRIGGTTFVDVFNFNDDTFRTYVGMSIYNPGSVDLIVSLGRAFSGYRDIVVPPSQFAAFDNITMGCGARDNITDETLSHVRAALASPSGTPASATIGYAAAQPSNEELINIGTKVYEFSSDESVNGDNIYVEIGVDADASYTNLVAAIIGEDQSLTASVDTGTDVVTVTSNYGGTYGNGVVCADGATPTGATFSGNLAGGTGGIAVSVHVW